MLLLACEEDKMRKNRILMIYLFYRYINIKMVVQVACIIEEEYV